MSRETSGGGSALKTRPVEKETARKGHYEPIAASFKHDGFSYRQIAREGSLAIYKQTWIRPEGDLSENVAYEVIRIQWHEAHTFPSGKSYPRREAYPTSAVWGVDGFTLPDKDTAYAKLREQRQVSERLD
jgi:hypothetical protein